MNFYSAIIYFITAIIFSLSVYYFYKILELLRLRKIVVQCATIALVFIPAIFIFIGYLDSWENIALSSQIILFYFILSDWSIPSKKNKPHTILASFWVLSAIVRPHLLLSYLALICLVIFLFILNNYFRKSPKRPISSIKTALVGLVILILVHIPIFKQNHKYFGKYFLSTQSEFEFFQGHNPFARSSWNYNLITQHQPYFDSVFAVKKINRTTNWNEYEEAKFYSGLAKEWIAANPGKEFMLDIKKICGFFIPYNHNNNRINFYTIFLECSFLLFIFLFLKDVFKKRTSGIYGNDFEINLLVLTPVMMSLLLTVLFFVGHRWRYYAEPFLLIMAAMLINRFLENKDLKTSQS